MISYLVTLEPFNDSGSLKDSQPVVEVRASKFKGDLIREKFEFTGVLVPVGIYIEACVPALSMACTRSSIDFIVVGEDELLVIEHEAAI